MGLLAVLGVSAGCASGKPTALDRRQAVRDAQDKTYRSTEGFQTVRWGMTPDEVRAELPEAAVGPDGTLRMKATIAEVPAEVSLGFLDNRLAAVDVFFPDVADPRTFHSLMRDLLTRKYGEPKAPIEVARALKWEKLPIRFAADLAPIENVEASATVQTTESMLSSQSRPKLLNRWTTLESHVNLTQWSLLSRSIMAIQYESAKYAPRRADLIGRYSTKARQDLVKDL
ncbi:hypothetical protein D7W81_20295 [Corallococcus aberystwythensis]|uniref:Uncharacterized protein n=1 Tax=Corallococcus aberystwythensis TaxID=2316722 RepID=A0A3A8Q4C4_9BACT|nr:hypothetical protein D7W81_20295 [Corallococcus aberystwythensis]